MSGRVLLTAGAVCGVLALLAGCSPSARPDAAGDSPSASGSAAPPVGSVGHPRPITCVEGVMAVDGGAGDAEGDGSPTTGGAGAGGMGGTTGAAGAQGSAPGSGAAGSGSTGSGGPASDSASGGASSGSSGSGSAGPGGAAAGGRGPGGPALDGPSGFPGAAADVTVGPLTWPGLGGLASGDQRTHGVQGSGGWHYRIGPDLAAGAVVTVTVGEEQRARAGLEYGAGYIDAPAPAVTFHSCPAAPTSFDGGFFVAGDGRACVPLEVRIGDAAPRRVVVSFFMGRCPA